MICAVVDTNVLVSALWTKNDQSATFRVAKLLQEGRFRALYNEEILTKYEEVLSRPKFKFPRLVIDTIIAYVREHGIHSERVPYAEAMPDEDDRVFYEVALSKEDAYLVTGNLKHFPVTPIVVTPAEMLEIVLADRDTNYHELTTNFS